MSQAEPAVSEPSSEMLDDLPVSDPGSAENDPPREAEAVDSAPAILTPACQDRGTSSLEPAQGSGSGGCACSPPAGPPEFVYAIGTLRPVFPDLSVREEFRYAVNQVPGGSETSYHLVFTYQPSPPSTPSPFFYIAEHCCWLLEIDGVDTYLLQPRSTRELRDLVDAIPPEDEIEPRMTVAIGLLGPAASTELCGHELPVVLVNQVYHFELKDLVAEIQGGSPPMPEISQEAIIGVLRALELKPNRGDTDAERALNYVGLRYREVYQKADELCTGAGAKMYLSAVRTEPGEVQGTRRIIDVVFEFKRRQSEDVIFYYCSVDVTGLFPFLQSALRLYVPVKET